MKTTQRFEDIPVDTPISLAIGVFDGIHRGHQHVLNEARRAAFSTKGEAWMMSFYPHPLKVLSPERAPDLIYTPQQTQKRLKELNMDGWLAYPFNQEFATHSPDYFIGLLLTGIPSLKTVCVGENWRFGHKAMGTPTYLKEQLDKHDIEVKIIETLVYEGHKLSSTEIRRFIHDGDVEHASYLLGHPYSLAGFVGHGKKMGRTYGFPTANIAIENECKPGGGIYAASLRYRDRFIRGAGYYPELHPPQTIQGKPVFEVHLLDFDEDLYGKKLELFLHKRIRSDQAFENSEALVEQIGLDIEAVKHYFTSLES